MSVHCSPVREKKSTDCTKESAEKANQCAEKLWFAGRHSRKYPENNDQMNKHCKETTELIACVKDHTDRCANDIQRHLANVMLFTMKTNDKHYCGKSAKRQEFLSLGVCANQIRDQTNKCMERFLLMLGKSNKYQTKYKVPFACWYVINIIFINYNLTNSYLLMTFSSFHELKQCIVKSAHNLNSDHCSDSSTESLEKYLNALSINTLNLMCNEYEEESDKCQSIPKLAKGVKYSRALNIIDGFGNILKDVIDKH